MATLPPLVEPAAELTKDERNVAKMVNFGIIYGISAFGLSENLEIPREQAQEYIDRIDEMAKRKEAELLEV